jgi:hypothetical protein
MQDFACNFQKNSRGYTPGHLMLLTTASLPVQLLLAVFGCFFTVFNHNLRSCYFDVDITVLSSSTARYRDTAITICRKCPDFILMFA